MRSVQSLLQRLFVSPNSRPHKGFRNTGPNRFKGAIEKLEDRTLLTATLVQGDASETANRVDLVIMGDGYDASEIGPGSQFATDTQDFLDFLFDPTRDSSQSPFHRYEEFFNVWRIDLASPESGTDIPAAPDTTLQGNINNTVTTITVADASEFSVDLPFVIQIGNEQMQVTAVNVGTNMLTVVRGFNGTAATNHNGGANVMTLGAVFKNTLLDSSYRFGGGPEELLNVNQFKTRFLAQNELGFGVNIDMGLVLVNSAKFGGGGGGETFAVMAAQDPTSRDLGLRELMRNYSNLGLENDDGDPTMNTMFMGTLMGEPNLSLTNAFVPWNQWNGFSQPGIGVISAFPGALGADTDIFRPSSNSKLRTLGNPFDVVSREAIVLDFYDHVNPLDSHTPNGTAITNPATTLVLEAVGDALGGPVNDIFEVIWRIDGNIVIDPNTGLIYRERTLKPTDFGFTTGNFIVEATITDLAGQRFGGGADLVRRDQSKLSQTVIWQVQVPIVQAPTLVTPLGITTNPLPPFTWTPNGPNGVTWELRVFDIETGDRVLTELGLTNTTFTPTTTLINDTFISGRTYRWTVRGIDANGRPGDYSNQGIFTVRSEAPALQGPLNPTADVTPTFMWNGVEAAVSYDLMVLDVTNGAPIVGGIGPASVGVPVIDVQGILAMQYTDATLLERGKTFEWMVRPRFAGNIIGNWSTPGIFSTNTTLDVPTVLTPMGPGQSTTPTFSWTGVEGAQFYDLWVNDLTDGTTEVIREQNLTTMNFVPGTPLTANHRYLVTVRAIGEDGLKGRFASHKEFSVNTNLERPMMQAPVGSNQSTTPKFQWSAVPGAVAYDLWVNNLTTRQQEVIREKNLTSTMFTPTTPLDDQNQYIVTVRAIGAAGNFSEWAPHRQFTVGTPLETPRLLSPKGNGNVTTPEFKWSPVAGADRYELWVNNLTTKQQEIIRRDDITGTTYTDPTPLVHGNRYVFTVRAISANGGVLSVGGGNPITSLWATNRQFTVGTSLARPTLITPVGSTTDTTPTFEWTVVVGAVRYEIRVNNLTTGDSSVIQNENIVGTSYTDPTPLTVGNSYLWTIRAFDANGNFSDWAPHRSFTVQGVAAINEQVELHNATFETTDGQEPSWQLATLQSVTIIDGADEGDKAAGEESVQSDLADQTSSVVIVNLEVAATDETDQPVVEKDVDNVMTEWKSVEWWADRELASKVLDGDETGDDSSSSAEKLLSVAGPAILGSRWLRPKKGRQKKES